MIKGFRKDIWIGIVISSISMARGDQLSAIWQILIVINTLIFLILEKLLNDN